MKKFMTGACLMLSCILSPGQTAREKIVVENALLDEVRLMETGKVDKTMGDRLRKLAERDSTNDAVFYYLGKLEFASGNTDSAVKAFEKASSLDPENDDYSETLAKVYARNGKVRESTDIYLALLKKNPAKYRNAYTLTILADQNLVSYRDTLALENYEAALLYEPDYTPAILGKSEVYRMRNNLPAFFSTLREFTTDGSVMPYPKCEYVNNILRHIDGNLFRNWGAQLDTLVTDCPNTHPNDSSCLKLAGRWYYGTGRKEEGRKYFDRLLENYPEDIEAHFIRLQILADDDDCKGMIEESKAIISLANGNKDYIVPAMSTIGDCYYEMGRAKEAYKWYDKTLKVNPEYLPVLNNYAYYLSLERKNLSKARKMSAVTVSKEPDNPTYLDTYGWILHLLGEDKEAKLLFKHAMLYGGKDNAEVLLHYSEVLRALGEDDVANYYKDLADNKK